MIGNVNFSTFKIIWNAFDVKLRQQTAIASLYHPPNPMYQESELLNHLSESIEQIFQLESNAKIIVAGDVNN